MMGWSGAVGAPNQPINFFVTDVLALSRWERVGVRA